MSIEVKPSSERKCTNFPALIFAIVFIVITVVLVTYCGIVAATNNKVLNGTDFNDTTEFEAVRDSCGNICGEMNSQKNAKCGDSDKRGKPFLVMNNYNSDGSPLTQDDDDFDDNLEPNLCVDVCPIGYGEVGNKCYDHGDLTELSKALKATWYYILIICFVAFIFSYVFLILFRHVAKYVIWIINIGFVVLVVGLAILCALAGAIEGVVIFGIMAIFLIILLIWFRKRIALVAKLFKEASKALIDVPAIMIEPVLTFISLIISFLFFASFAVIIAFAGDDEPLGTVAHVFNLISFTFITQFIIGCQNFIIAGSIVRWYFTRDKTKVHKPIKKSFSHLFKFHLGSVCLGAILITIVKIIKAVISSLKNQARESKNIAAVLLATCCMCLFDMIEKLLSYLVRNAYVVIAKEGTGFCDSGKRAYRLLMDNINDVVALNHFGDLVLMVCRLLIVLIAGLVGYTLLSQRTEFKDYIVLPLILGCILAFLIAHCFVMVFEMTVDTIFISFCIDLEENDGQTKPYYMSDSLKRIIMEMKQESGGTLVFGPKSGPGFEGEAGVPMLPPQQQPMYPNIGYGDPNNPQYPQLPHTQQPMMVQQGYTPALYGDQSYPQKY